MPVMARVTCKLDFMPAISSPTSAAFAYLSAEGQVSYKVLVKTSDIRGAGTDSNITLVIYGPKVHLHHVIMYRAPLDLCSMDHVVQRQSTYCSARQLADVQQQQIC
jgi:hypothetical protein